MTTTLRDVARLAGVSIRTVSNVVNGYAHVAEGTRTKVEDAVAELGYTPNLVARSLKRGRSKLVALVLPHFANPYFAELTSAFVDEGARRGYTVMIDQTGGDKAREVATVRRIAQNVHFDGLFISPWGLSAQEMFELRSSRPLILLGEDTHSQLDHVLIDNEAAAWEATTHLLRLGRRRIIAIGMQSPSPQPTSRLRYAGFRRALEDAGVAERADDFVTVPEFTRADGEAAMTEIHERGLAPDGIFCFSDVLAVGLLARAREYGYRIPEQIAIVGFDDVDEGKYAAVPLSSISPDLEWIARSAFDLLLDRLDDPAVAARQEYGPWSLRVRRSTETG